MARAGRGRPAAPPPEAPAADPDLLEAVEKSGLFDAAWYVRAYPDVGTQHRKGPLDHFVHYGAYEGRDPGPNFSTGEYLTKRPEATRSPLPAFLHAYKHADDTPGEMPWLPTDEASFRYLLDESGLFDGAWYLDRYADIAKAGLDPLTHFVKAGAVEGRDPGPDFEQAFYAERYPLYHQLARSPIDHHLRIGRRLGHVTKDRPALVRWSEAFDELTAADLDRIRADAAAKPVRALVLHVLDAAACARFEEIAAAYAGQVGAELRLRFVRGAAPDDLWAAAREGGRGGDAFVERASDLQALLATEDVALLTAGAAIPRPHAAWTLARTLERFGADAAYADHEVETPAGIRRPVFKPAMSPELLRHAPYVGPAVAASLRPDLRERVVASVEAAVGGEAGWRGLLLGLDRRRVVRAPFLLHRALGEAEESRGTSYEPVPMQETSPAPGGRGRSELAPSVEVIIPTRDRGDLLRECVESILSRSDYPADRLGITVVDNESTEPATLDELDRLRRERGVKIVPSPGRFNFSAVCNDGARNAEADILLFLNNDTSVRRPDWLWRLAEQAERPDVAAVGARLLYPDDTVQHGGVVVGVQGLGAHRLIGVPEAAVAGRDPTREMAAVTGACLAIRRTVFEELGGFDPILTVAFNDVQLCLDAASAGYRNVYVGEALLHHHESKSRGFDDTRTKRLRNVREAIYVRERHPRAFQNDPSYSPNLSLQAIGELAFPPRVVRPWRRATARPHVLILSRVHGLGDGVATVVAEQAAFLRERGWDVTVGGPPADPERPYPGCRRAVLATPVSAASFAVEEGVDCVLAHTPPFFSVVRYLGERPRAYFVDHGEPPPRLFPDRLPREDVDWEKRFCAPLATRVFTISQAIRREQRRTDAIVIRNGNSHLATWSEAWAKKRPALRAKFGFEGRFVALNVCRFDSGARFYKGVDRYAEVAADAPFVDPRLGGRVAFALAGRAGRKDVDAMREAGLLPFANVSDEEMTELYAASDLYMNFSEWEGYNLGIGQALAMGLPVIASDIPAHREFAIERSDDVVEIGAKLAERLAAWDESAAGRRAVVEPWAVPLTALAEVLEADRERDRREGAWF